MKPKATPAIRELAADICAVLASSDGDLWFSEACEGLLGKEHRLAIDLAADVEWEVWIEGWLIPARCYYAEAEARLRTGQLPAGWR